MTVSPRVSEIQIQTAGLRLGWSQFTTGLNSIKKLDAVLVLNFCTLSDNA